MDTDQIYNQMPGFVDEDSPIFHGFFGRNGGVSKGIYSALNCGPGSDDALNDVRENRKIVSQAVGCAPENLLTLYQVHGDVCVTVKDADDYHERPKADAHVSDVSGIALGILSADCTPILFHGVKADRAPVIGASHAGWGGALKGVSASTIDAMVALGALKDSIVACIGPCIAQESYEVSDAFLEPFIQEDAENRRFFVPSVKEGHLMFDLVGYNADKIKKAGVERVLIRGIDTCFNEEDFFSYRRATHRREKDYGRQISVIKIN